MGTKIAAWTIKDKWYKEIARFKYADRATADKCLGELREAKPAEGYVLQMVKEDLDLLATKVTNITTKERIVRGITEDKQTGERRFWRKVFVDVKVYSRYEGWTTIREYTKHYHKGSMRIMCPDVERSLDTTEFEEYAKRIWPTCWREVCLFFEE